MRPGPVFPPGYPEELKKYGYPPPFPPGYPPQQYEKYGYPPSYPPATQQGSSSVGHQTHPDSASVGQSTHQIPQNSGSIRDYGLVPLPWGLGSYIPIAGNVYNSGFNVNHSGTQESGDVRVGNHTQI